MKWVLIKNIEGIDKEFEATFNTYVNDTEKHADEYKELLENNAKSSIDISKFQKEINRLKEQTAFLTLKIS